MLFSKWLMSSVQTLAFKKKALLFELGYGSNAFFLLKATKFNAQLRSIILNKEVV